MGGLATAVAAGLVSILLLQCFAIYMNGSLSVSSLEVGAASDQAAIASASLSQRAQVGDIGLDNQTYLQVWVENTGSAAIPVSQLPRIDVILVGTLASNGTTAAIWVPFSSSNASSGWTVTNATNQYGGPKAIDPINFPYPTYGDWEPSDIIVLGLSLPASDAVNILQPVSVVFTMPSGYTAIGGS